MGLEEKVHIEQVLPADIEHRSFEIIGEELKAMGKELEPELAPVIMRAIHTTADFDYADHLKFSENVVEKAREAIKKGAVIITDTKMGWSGVNKKRLESYGGEALCFMADEDVAAEAKKTAAQERLQVWIRQPICLETEQDPVSLPLEMPQRL